MDAERGSVEVPLGDRLAGLSGPSRGPSNSSLLGTLHEAGRMTTQLRAGGLRSTAMTAANVRSRSR